MSRDGNRTRRARNVCAKLALAGLTALTASGCLEEDDGEASFGMPTVSILPEGGATSTVANLVASGQVSHPAGQTPSFAYSWKVNGADAMNMTPNVSKGSTAKHQTWVVSVMATYPSGRQDGPGTASIQIFNSPPTGDANISPSGGAGRCPGTRTYTSDGAGSDADGDPVTQMRQWSLNTVALAGETGTTYTDTFVSGDVIRIDVIPNDGEVNGPTASRTVSILEKSDRNFEKICGKSPVTGSSSSSPEAPRLAIASSIPATGGGPAETSASTPQTSSTLERPLSVGRFEVCAIGPAGEVACRGNEDSALIDTPEGRYVQVALASDYACAIGADDREIRCWGELPADSPLLAPPPGPYLQLGVGTDSACALRDSGEVSCWGDPDSTLAAPPEGAFQHLDVLESYACAIDAEGATSCWGD